MMIRDRRAFSIVELILVILIMTLLMAVAIPQIHAVKSRATDTVSAANMRTHAQVVQTYSLDYRGMAPFLADPDATYSVARGGGLTISYEFFGAVEVWGVPLVDEYYGFGLGSSQWDEHVDWSIFARPGVHGLLYQYCPTSFTSASYWNETTRGPNQLRPIRVSQVRYPSAKAVFMELDENRGFPVWAGRTLSENRGWAFASFDGSVDRPDSSRFTEPCSLGEGLSNGGRFTYGVVGLHTAGGVLGRDVE